MWVAVEDAEIAVAHAESHDAPVAELPGGVPLAAHGGRRAGRAAPPGAPAAPGCEPGRRVRRQVAEVIGAARDVQAAALRAGSDATEPQVRSLVRHARDEVDIVRPRWPRMRSLAQPR